MGLLRNATGASPPGALEVNGKVGDDSDRGKNGVDFLWENNIVVINRDGDIVETWKQWDKMLRRPHSVYISPYDPEKHVYVVDDYRHSIFKFTNDGKTLREDDRRAERARLRREALLPSDVHGVPGGRQLVRGRRLRQHARREVRQGRQLRDGVGRAQARRRKETRPGYFNNVHGVAVDPEHA